MAQICLCWLYKDGLKKRVCEGETTALFCHSLPVEGQTGPDDRFPPELDGRSSWMGKKVVLLFVLALFKLSWPVAAADLLIKGSLSPSPGDPPW